MGYTYLNSLTHAFIIIKMDLYIFLRQQAKKEEEPSHTHTNSHTESIYLSSMISYLHMRENRVMSNCVKK
jgi:hypothetical protein